MSSKPTSTGRPRAVDAEIATDAVSAHPNPEDLRTLDAALGYGNAIRNTTIPCFLLADWTVGYFLPILRSSGSTSRTYHAPDPTAENPQTPCDNHVSEDREWMLTEWCHYRAWAEPCGTDECQEQFEKMGMDVHSNGRDGDV